MGAFGGDVLLTCEVALGLPFVRECGLEVSLAAWTRVALLYLAASAGSSAARPRQSDVRVRVDGYLGVFAL
jgi:hypothetical protein